MAKFLFYDDRLINIFLQEEKPSGGAAVQAYGWIKGLLDTGHDVYILTHWNDNVQLKEDCRELKIMPLFDQEKGIRWLRWLYYRLPFVYKRIKQTKPDFFYLGIPGWTSSLFGIICYLLQVKFIIRISSDIVLDDRPYKPLSIAEKFLQRIGFKLSYCILCQNDYQLGVIKKEFPQKRVIKLTNPFFSITSNYVESVGSRQYIAWLGIFRYPKNLKLLYEIAFLLKEEQFVIAGSKGTNGLDTETFTYLGKLKQLSNVRFIGFLNRKQVLPFLQNAKYLLNTSRYEGFSNTFLEAMSIGTPIITTNKVNPDSIISKFNLGVVYSDPADLKDQYLSVTEEAYRGLTQNCLNYVSKNHNYKSLAEKLVQSLSA
jgi:glycosyltransferase involved in cell wall biosynthesis